MADEYVGRPEFTYRIDGLVKEVGEVKAELQKKVPLDTWALQNTHTASTIADLDRDCRERTEAVEKAASERFKKIDKGREITWARALALLGIATTILGIAIGAYLTTKGIAK